VLATGWFWIRRGASAGLLRRLPGENVLLIYADLARLRQTGALAPLLRAQVTPSADYARFVEETGFDYQRDLDAAAVCYLPDRVYVLAQGRFDGERLRQYAASQGGGCKGSDLDQPCWMPASQPGRQISLLLLGPNLLALATAPEPEAVLALRSPPSADAQHLAQTAAELNDGSPLVWLTASPAGLDQAGRQAPSPNLALFSRALAGAQRAYVFLNDLSPDLQLAVRAVCHSAAQAEEMRRLIQGLNDFLGGLLRGVKKPEAPGWEQVLASAVVEQKGNTVHASWRLNAQTLETLGAAGEGVRDTGGR
jgi:hypothetical protein